MIFIDYGVVSLDINSQMQFAVIMPRQRGRGGGVGRLSGYQRYRQSQQSHPTTTHTSNPIDPKQLQHEFESELEKLDLFECTNCHRLQLRSEGFDEYSKCKTNPNKFSADNNMDPGAVLVLKHELVHGLEPELRGIIRCVPTFGEFVSPMSALLHISLYYKKISLPPPPPCQESRGGAGVEEE